MSRESMPIYRGSIGDPKGRLDPLPWPIIAPHERQAQRNHGQTLNRLAERGGLSASEAVAILEDREWRAMTEADAVNRLATFTPQEKPT